MKIQLGLDTKQYLRHRDLTPQDISRKSLRFSRSPFARIMNKFPNFFAQTPSRDPRDQFEKIYIHRQTTRNGHIRVCSSKKDEEGDSSSIFMGFTLLGDG